MTTLSAPPNTRPVAASGRTYVANAHGVIYGVHPSDVASLCAAGCAVADAPPRRLRAPHGAGRFLFNDRFYTVDAAGCFLADERDVLTLLRMGCTEV